MAKDIEKLQGTWRITSLEVEGRKMPASAFEGSKIVVEGDRFTAVGMGADYGGIVQIGKGRKPRTLDMKFTAGPETGNTSLGIYELGDDAWTLCLTLRGNTRPDRFATTPGSGHALETLRRETASDIVRPAKDEIRGKPQGDAAPELAGTWTMVSLVRDGEHTPASVTSHGRREATASETTVFMGKSVIMKARYAVNRSVVPHAMDYVVASGASQLGIYEVVGGRLKMCFSPPGQPRPNTFESVPGDGRTLVEWKAARK